MSTIEIDINNRQLLINSIFHCYGDAVSEQLVDNIKQEIETMWNAPQATLMLEEKIFAIRFKVTTVLYHLINKETILSSEYPAINFIRIEEQSKINISYVDGVGSNTGYFITANMQVGTTSMAHEFGHLMGLKHPEITDCRGEGRPHIMYPRGSLVDPEFQYDSQAKAGEVGGTLNPIYRVVTQQNIEELNIVISIQNHEFVLGKNTNRYHEKFIANPITLT